MADGSGIFKGSSSLTKIDEDKVWGILRLFSEAQQGRSTFATHWQEVAELILPTYRNTFFYPNQNTPGEKKTERQIDAQGALALSRYAAILDSLLTPRNQTWHRLEADDPYIMKDRASRLWFEEATRVLFRERYKPSANFQGQNHSGFMQVGAWGTDGLFIDQNDSGPGLRYKDIPMGELYLFENHQGLINGFIRCFRLTAMQAMGVSQWKGRLPEQIHRAMEKNTQQQFTFLHYVAERGDYDQTRLDAKGKPYQSCYVSIEGRCLLSEGGYRTFPLAVSRHDQGPGEVYGRGPAMQVLPALKTKNAQKRVFLKQGHRAADPVLLMADDGIMDFNMRPGAFNKGGMSQDGRPLVGVLPTGNIQISEKMMEAEGAIINDAFLVSLFQIMVDSPQMTATEVIERVNEKGILLAPTVGRQESERLGPQIDRELDVLASQGLLPPMPPRLREAGGSYSVVYTSPLSKAAKAQEAAGFMRTLESVKELVSITQDPALLDPFDFDVAIPGIADIQSVPESWMASPDMIANKRQVRAQAAQQKAKVEAAPAQAQLLKARAAMMSAGIDSDQGI
jgi:Bacteriophage head to tail connecting protein